MDVAKEEGEQAEQPKLTTSNHGHFKSSGTIHVLADSVPRTACSSIKSKNSMIHVHANSFSPNSKQKRKLS